MPAYGDQSDGAVIHGGGGTGEMEAIVTGGSVR